MIGTIGSMQVGELVGALDERFPFSGAAEWDPVGLQIGDASSPAGTVAVCHEITESTVARVENSAIDTLVAYHPLLFVPTVTITAGPTPTGRALRLARRGTNVVVVHTALDAATPGTGDHLLDVLGIESAGVFAPTDDGDPTTAIGRIGTLDGALDAHGLGRLVGERLEVPCRIADAGRPIHTVAVVPGSGGSFVEQAAAVADALVTGDVNHHRAVAAVDAGLSIIDAGHPATERAGIRALYAAVYDMIRDTVHMTDDPTPWET